MSSANQRIACIGNYKIVQWANQKSFNRESLIKKPDLLILDNPFAGLDEESRNNFMIIINDLIISGVKIILVTSPDEIPEMITHYYHLKILKSLQLQSSPVKEEFKIAAAFNKVQVKYGSK